MATGRHFEIREPSQRGEARRAAAALAELLEFGDERAGRVAVVVNELSGNLLKHTPGGGDLFVTPIERRGAAAVEVVTVDRGPGIDDHRRALRDGYSTAGSAGTGLGAVSRLSDAFDLYSLPDRGTIVLARIWRDGRPDARTLDVGAICATMQGETVPGDAWAVADVDGRTRVLVSDGLGHGRGAQEASAEAVRVFEHSGEAPLADVLEAMHRALRPTRGAAVAVAEIDGERRRLRYAGLGNISGLIVGRESSRSLISHNGTVGHAMRRIQEFAYELPPDSLVVLHSDGLRTHWRLESYPRLAQRPPTVIAATLYREFQRGRDDATALVVRVP